MDAIPISTSYYIGQDLTDIMFMTKAGVLWLVDFDDCATLKISSTHYSDKNINKLLYLADMDNYDSGLLFSASNDCMLKIWEL